MDNTLYTAFVITISDKLVPQNDCMKKMSIDDIKSMFEKDIMSEGFANWIYGGAYGDYIPLITDGRTRYFESAEYGVSMPLMRCIQIQNLFFKDYDLCVQFTILNTPYGKMVYDKMMEGLIPIFCAYVYYVYDDNDKDKLIGFNIRGLNINNFVVPDYYEVL